MSWQTAVMAVEGWQGRLARLGWRRCGWFGLLDSLTWFGRDPRQGGWPAKRGWGLWRHSERWALLVELLKRVRL